MRYGGVRALSSTISIGTRHNGGGDSDEDVGDAGHGVILLAFALFLAVKEDSLAKMGSTNEIFNIFFGGRYIITMMGVFSIYTGLIYNDIFSKSFNIFGSHWAFREDIFANGTQDVNLGETIMLDPGNFSQYKGHNLSK